MPTKATIEPIHSPVPGVIPEPAYVHDEADAADQRRIAAPTASDTPKPAPSSRRRNPARGMLAKLVGAIRGDKYMANAYPPAWRSPTDTGGLRQSHSDNVPATVQSVVVPDSGAAQGTAPAASRITER